MSWRPLLLLTSVLLIPDSNSQNRIVCYYESWGVYRAEPAKYSPGEIDPFLCTHIIYAFGNFSENDALIPLDNPVDIVSRGYFNFTGLKTRNKDLKTLLGVGGWNEGSSRFSPLVASRDRRQKFTKNVVSFLNEHNFDGLDLDWDYPGSRYGGKPEDKENYAQFIREIREEFDRASSGSNQPSISVPSAVLYYRRGFDIPKINKYVDWYNILSYDYSNVYDLGTNHHSPLYGEMRDVLNVNFTISLYLGVGADASKLVLGIPTYGRSFTLLDADDVGFGAPADGPGDAGPYTQEKGYLAYHEICQNINNNNWTVVQSNTNFTGPYAYSGNQWVGYDDEAMVARKAQYVADNRLGGIMFWSLINDDFNGDCSGQRQTLISAGKQALQDRLRLIQNDRQTIFGMAELLKSVEQIVGPENFKPTSSNISTTSVTLAAIQNPNSEVIKIPMERKVASNVSTNSVPMAPTQNSISEVTTIPIERKVTSIISTTSVTMASTQNPISKVTNIPIERKVAYKSLTKSNEVKKEIGTITLDDTLIKSTLQPPLNMHSIPIEPYGALEKTQQSASNKEPVSEQNTRVPYKVKIINRTTGSITRNYYGNVINYNIKLFKFSEKR